MEYAAAINMERLLQAEQITVAGGRFTRTIVRRGPGYFQMIGGKTVPADEALTAIQEWAKMPGVTVKIISNTEGITLDPQEKIVDNYVPQEPDEPRGKIRIIKPGEFCLAVLNTPGMIITEEDKQRFIEELREHHANGRYIVGVKDSDQFKISSKNPEMLAKQIANFDELIRATFERL